MKKTKDSLNTGENGILEDEIIDESLSGGQSLKKNNKAIFVAIGLIFGIASIVIVIVIVTCVLSNVVPEEKSEEEGRIDAVIENEVPGKDDLKNDVNNDSYVTEAANGVITKLNENEYYVFINGNAEENIRPMVKFYRRKEQSGEFSLMKEYILPEATIGLYYDENNSKNYFEVDLDDRLVLLFRDNYSEMEIDRNWGRFSCGLEYVITKPFGSDIAKIYDRNFNYIRDLPEGALSPDGRRPLCRSGSMDMLKVRENGKYGIQKVSSGSIVLDYKYDYDDLEISSTNIVTIVDNNLSVYYWDGSLVGENILKIDDYTRISWVSNNNSDLIIDLETPSGYKCYVYSLKTKEIMEESRE